MKNAVLGCLLVGVGLGLGCRQTEEPRPKYNYNMAATPGPNYTPDGKLMPIAAGGSDSSAYLQDQAHPSLKRQAASQPVTAAGTPVGGATSAPAGQTGETPASAPAAGGATSAPASAPTGG